jgi:twitching motility protein PilT
LGYAACAWACDKATHPKTGDWRYPDTGREISDACQRGSIMSTRGLTVDTLLRTACEKRASDLHLKAGNHPYVRVDGELHPLTQYPRISPEDMLDFASSIMTTRQKARFKENTEVDMPYGIAGLARFRVNIFQQRGNVGMVFRVIPTNIRAFEELSLPKVMEKICEETRGLVLVAGTTSCGKSTTLAAMVDYINSTRTDHIITIEDPIEFLHRDKKGLVSQREVEVDSASFASALRAALRQDPDVILVGEMRDLETIQTAMLAAETGHLVLSTLHTTDATETVLRIIAVFQPGEQKRVRLQLASTLKAVICQRLVRRSDGLGRVPAVEVLVSTEYIRDCIVNPEKTRLIAGALAAGTSQYGMQTFDQSLYDLYSRRLITLEEALANSSNPDEFKLRIAGVRSTTDAARDEMERAIQVERFAQR